VPRSRARFLVYFSVACAEYAADERSASPDSAEAYAQGIHPKYSYSVSKLAMLVLSVLDDHGWRLSADNWREKNQIQLQIYAHLQRQIPSTSSCRLIAATYTVLTDFLAAYPTAVLVPAVHVQPASFHLCAVVAFTPVVTLHAFHLQKSKTSTETLPLVHILSIPISPKSWAMAA
jgi:hypothetical protein